MRNQKKTTLFLVLMLLMITVTACMNPSTEEIKSKMKEKLYEEYGEEFVVDRIGSRSSRGQKFYQARFYPKSIVGTSKEKDDYYHGEASMEKEILGFSGVADNYGEIKRSLEIEKVLLGKAKKSFGKKVLLKVEQRYEKRNSNGYFVSYLDPNYEEVIKRIEKEPDNHRLLLELDIYIFDRIEDEAEKEERRKEIFQFVQYLKKEGLFEYLELVIKIVDEKALTSSYRKYKRKLDLSNKAITKINGIKVELPSKGLTEKMKNKLGKEVKESKEKQLIERMNEIKKSELGVDGIEGYLEQYFIRICSIKMMKVQPYGEYEEVKERGELEKHKYLKIDDIHLGEENLKYIYRSQDDLNK